jgi:AraC family transcriptional regulator, regulatory protein of adaptative response / DNA-3-methyladenine glycosylase II
VPRRFRRRICRRRLSGSFALPIIIMLQSITTLQASTRPRPSAVRGGSPLKLTCDQCYEAIKARDTRFDGVFFCAVSTTRVYCRPVCTVRTPGRDRCTFYANAASAEAAGYRPCLRCRPELAPGSAPIDTVSRIARLAIGRIDAGALCDSRIETLAAEFNLSSRQLRRIIQREYGASPVELEQTRRLLLAKRLLTDTPMRIVDVAFASGFGSVRRFNHLFRTRYRLNPRDLRRRPAEAAEGAVTLKLAYRPPLSWPALVGFLASRGAPSAERVEGDRYLRALKIGRHGGWIAAAPDPERNLIRVNMSATLLPVLPRVLAGVRQLFDLDANPAAISERLGSDRRLAAHVRRNPGIRIPGSFDGFDLALRAILGQQITVKAATTLYGRFVQKFGPAVKTPFAGLDRAAPKAEPIAEANLPDLISLGLTRQRAETVKGLASAVVNGELDLVRSTDHEQARTALRAIRGIGPWTIEYIALRVLGDPDAFPSSDLGLLRSLELRRASELEAIAEAWRPWRAYAAIHLWNGHGSATGGAVNDFHHAAAKGRRMSPPRHQDTKKDKRQKDLNGS